MIIETSCKDCVFAVYEKVTQVGCAGKLIEKYKEKGVRVDECYDEEKEFYVLRDKCCVFKRTKNTNQTFEEIRNSARLKFNIVIKVQNDSTLDDIIKTLDSAVEQNLKPEHIVIAVNNPNIKVVDVIDKVGGDFNYKGVSYGVSMIRIVQHDSEGIVFAVSPLLKHPWVAVFDAGYSIPSDFCSSINFAVNYEFETILYVLPEEGDGTVINAAAYHYFRQVDPKSELTILDRLKEHLPDKIFTRDKLCQIKSRFSQELTVTNQ